MGRSIQNDPYRMYRTIQPGLTGTVGANRVTATLAARAHIGPGVPPPTMSVEPSALSVLEPRRKGTLGITGRRPVRPRTLSAAPRCRLAPSTDPSGPTVKAVRLVKEHVSWVDIRVSEVRFLLEMSKNDASAAPVRKDHAALASGRR